MPELKLVCEFIVSGGQTTSFTVPDAKPSMSKETIGGLMQDMVDSTAFATEKGQAYVDVGSARYVEETQTPIFDNTNQSSDDDWSDTV